MASVFGKFARPTYRHAGAIGVGSMACAPLCAQPPAAAGEKERPTLRFGAIADVQYADVEDAWNFRGTQFRGYRSVLTVLRNAVSDWVKEVRLDFVLDMGDIIDQQCETQGDSREALRRVLKLWEPLELLKVPVQRLLGNHELYNFSREDCARLIPGITPWYRSLSPAAGWRVLVLDPYDLNIIERGGGSHLERGFEYLRQHNPNDLRAPRGTVDLTSGLEGNMRRFVPMGGAMDGEQLEWLRAELESAAKVGERVIVCTHIPLLPEASVPSALCWNFDEVMELLRGPGRQAVALVLAGHFHGGGYVMDPETGAHHVTLPSPLHAADALKPGQTQEDLRAHCVVEVFSDRIEIFGSGLVPSRTLPLDFLHAGAAATAAQRQSPSTALSRL